MTKRLFATSLALLLFGGFAKASDIPAGFLGVNTIEAGGGSPEDRAETVRRIKDAGFSGVRVNFVWRYLQPQNGDEYNEALLAHYDDYIDKLNKAGLAVLAISTTAPDWSLREGTPDPQAHARHAGFLASRYKGKIGAYQIFNEVNMPSNWPSGAATYAKVLGAARDAIKEADPDALVVLSGIAYDQNAFPFLQQLRSEKGGDAYDIAAFHAYPQEGQSLRAWVTDFLRELPAGKRRLWITEIGASTAHTPDGKSVPGAMDESAQARYGEHLDTLKKIRGVERVFWYELNDHDGPGMDADQNNAEKEFRFGIYRIDGSPKPLRDELLKFQSR